MLCVPETKIIITYILDTRYYTPRPRNSVLKNVLFVLLAPSGIRAGKLSCNIRQNKEKIFRYVTCQYFFLKKFQIKL